MNNDEKDLLNAAKENEKRERAVRKLKENKEKLKEAGLRLKEKGEELQIIGEELKASGVNKMKNGIKPRLIIFGVVCLVIIVCCIALIGLNAIGFLRRGG